MRLLGVDFCGGFMPIRKYISGATFGPETIKDMTTAFERIRRVLKLKDPDDPLIEVVAKKVISLASQGTLDPKFQVVDAGMDPSRLSPYQ
jgi:hypothetical protein